MKTMSPKTEQRTRWSRGPRVALGAGAAIAVVVLAVFAIGDTIFIKGASGTDTYYWIGTISEQ